MAQRPSAIGILLCEQVVVEAYTDNLTLVNCFSHREVEHFPSEPFPFIVFAILSDGHGELAMQLRIDRLDSFDVVYSRNFVLHFSDPLRPVRCMLKSRRCSFPVPGDYQVTLFADKEPIAQQRISITQGRTS